MIYIDITDLLSWRGHFTGIQRTVYNLADQLQKGYKQDVRLVIYKNGTMQLYEDGLESLFSATGDIDIDSASEHITDNKLKDLYSMLPMGFRVRLTPTMSRLKSVKSRTVSKQKSPIDTDNKFTKSIAFSEDDVLFAPGCLWDDLDHLEYLRSNAKARTFKLAVIVYDLIPLFHAHSYGPGFIDTYTKYLLDICATAQLLIAISENTKMDIETFILESGIRNNPRIEVIRLGDDVTPRASEKPRIISSEDFAIFVGTIEQRKNHAQLYYALRLAYHENKLNQIPHIYIIGKKGWLSDDVNYLLSNDYHIKNKITIIHDVTDEELNYYYSKAKFSIYPSQYEGWGLPVAESLLWGTPVISSNLTSLNEISPELVNFISPYDTRALMVEMIKFSDSEYTKSLKNKIKKLYKPVQWSTTAYETYNYLKK